jgi:hypothetical protein
LPAVNSSGCTHRAVRSQEYGPAVDAMPGYSRTTIDFYKTIATVRRKLWLAVFDRILEDT